MKRTLLIAALCCAPVVVIAASSFVAQRTASHDDAPGAPDSPYEHDVPPAAMTAPSSPQTSHQARMEAPSEEVEPVHASTASIQPPAASAAATSGECLDELLARIARHRVHQEWTLFDGTPLDGETPREKVLQHIGALEYQLDLQAQQLAVAGVGGSPLARWVRERPEGLRPSPESLRQMASAFREFPLSWSQAEGEWLMERLSANDWKRYGATRSEAILLHLGPQRVVEALRPEQALALQRLQMQHPQHFQ